MKTKMKILLSLMSKYTCIISGLRAAIDMRRKLIPLFCILCSLLVVLAVCGTKPPAVREIKTFTYPAKDKDIYIYTLPSGSTPEVYDETAFATCLQGIYNRENGPVLYMINNAINRPDYWLEIFTTDPSVGWLRGRRQVYLETIEELYDLVKPFVKKAVIWDLDVDASFNVATTIAGVEDGVVLSPDYAEKILPMMGLDSADIIDLRGMFTGAVTGSKKNDAYRWAIEQYLAKGLNAKNILCVYHDPFLLRERGNMMYVQQRDWPVYRRAFVFDLSPWGDEQPPDDPDQTMGLDLETYRMILAEQLRQNEGKNMTEVAGFFNHWKYSHAFGGLGIKHDGVPTEWEVVHVISEFNSYQNTATEHTFNQSFHSQFPFEPLTQSRPPRRERLRNAVYINLYYGDYDSTWPLFHFMPDFWEDEKRGSLPLGWAINPNLIETYPDIITYYYKTAVKDMDVFTASASAAGYFNPSRIQEQYWDMVVEHNRHFYNLTDMTITPMILDFLHLSDSTLDRMTQFSPDGISAHIANLHSRRPTWQVDPRVHNGVVIDNIVSGNAEQMEHAAQWFAEHLLKDEVPGKPSFYHIRVTWKSPSWIYDVIAELRTLRPELDIRVVNPYEYYRLHKQHLEPQR